MSRRVLFVIATLTLIAAVWRIAWRASSSAGAYDITTGEIVCASREICLHEAAHKADAEAGWTSQGDAWKVAVDVYREAMWLCVECRDEMALLVVFFPGIGAPYQRCRSVLDRCYWQEGWGGYGELYAAIAQKANGNPEKMPAGFRDFYDFQRIDALVREAGYGE